MTDDGRKAATPFEILKTKRATVRAQATKEVKSVSEKFGEVTEQNRVEAQASVTKLKRYQEQLAGLDQQILSVAAFKDTELTTEIEREQHYADSILDAVDILQAKLNKIRISPSQADTQQQAQNQTETKSRVKTPKLELTNFDGDPLKWQEFWDDFTCSIDERKDLSTIDKFKLLKQSLKKDALSLADGYFLTQRNYQEVKDALKERFGDPQVAIFAHFEALLELEPASHEVEQLIRIRDKSEAHIRSLAALGLSEDTYGLVFASIILSKLPRFVKMEMHRRNGSTAWTLAALREHLKEEIRVRTKSDRSFAGSSDNPSSSKEGGGKAGKSAKNPGGTATTLHIQSGKGKAKDSGSSKSGRSAKPVSCVFCQGSHHNWECTKYPTAESRLPLVQGRCFVCFSDKHLKKACQSRNKCYYCKNPGHNSSLCYAQFGKPPSAAGANAGPKTSDHSNVAQSLNPTAPEFVSQDGTHAVRAGRAAQVKAGKAILESAPVQVSGSKGSSRARVIFDTGSSMSFIHEGFAKKVGAKSVGQYQTKLSRFGDFGRETKKYPVVQVRIHLLDGSEMYLSLHQVKHVSAPMRLVPISLENISPLFDADEFAELVTEPAESDIHILLGLDYYYDIMGPEISRASNGIIVKQTAIGKIVTGFLREGPMDPHSDSQMLVMSSSEAASDLQDLERFWRIEEVGVVEKTVRSDDEAAVDLFNSSVRFVDGRYEVKWPFRQDPPNLPLNYDVALRRLVSVHRKLKGTPDLLATYHQILQDQLQKGVIEDAPVSPEGPVHYLPHHAVVIPSRETTKVRLVFDASSKPSSQFHSLNEAMYRGPVFLNSLIGLLLRFRYPKFAVTSDVEKAFLQISLHVSHRDCTRFLWLRDPNQPIDPANLVVYRYTRVLFGATASPFLLAATIIHHLNQTNTEISRKLIDCTYMDNIINGFDTSEDLLEYFHEAKRIIGSMNMNLHQWYSNSGRFMDAIIEGERGTRSVPSVLGLKWNVSEDTMACTVGKDSFPVVTKRNILRCTASVYDPCGWFSPVTISGKILMQQLWEEKMGWDQEVSTSLQKTWEIVAESFRALGSQTIPRQNTWSKFPSHSKFELHVFCDASSKAYSAVVFLRSESSDGVFCDLLFAKSRVAPLKRLTIPKLELEAARIGKRLLVFVEENLKLPISSRTLWTDSDCTLCWIENDRVKTTFVQNRVQEIRSVPHLNFRHVPSERNPADIGSRGTTMKELSSFDLWWKGPPFLTCSPSEWPKRPEHSAPTPEEKDSSNLAVSDPVVMPDECFQLDQYSSLVRLLRVTAYVKRACLLFRRQPCAEGPLHASETKNSLTFWEKRIQNQHSPHIQQGSLNPKWRNVSHQLGLFIDEQGYIRCRGRLQNSSALSEDSKHPILLPKESLFTRLVVLNSHSRVLHYGVKHTLSSVRERYWIPQGRSVVKSVLLKCSLCRKHTGGPFRIPEPPPLPDFRVSIKQPFACVGLDYLGPLFVRDGSGTKKIWISLFTCAVTRAIHLEVVQSLSAADFLLCFRRFAALYGFPHLIISDNARQFKAADQLLKKEFKRLAEDETVVDAIPQSGVTWKYIVEKAPWMGGFYERLVGIVKEGLKKSVGQWTLTSEELATLCYEISFVVNSRPLLYAEDNPSEPVLIPLDLLFRPNRCFPDGSGDEVFQERSTKVEELMMHWRVGQNLLRQFWDIWKSSYLVSLREISSRSQNRGTSDIQASPGVVVLIEENIPRGQWQIGRIQKIHRSADGQIRSAQVKLPSGTVLSRPIKLLYPIEGSLEAETPDNTDNSSNQPSSVQTTNQAQILSRPRRQAAEKAEQRTKQMLSKA